MRMSKLENIKSELMSCKTKKKALNQLMQNQLKDKPETHERVEKLQEMRKSASEIEKLTKKREVLKSCTRAYYDECCIKLKASVDLCNKHTENIQKSCSFLKSRNPSITVLEINKHFGIPEDLDTI